MTSDIITNIIWVRVSYPKTIWKRHSPRHEHPLALSGGAGLQQLCHVGHKCFKGWSTWGPTAINSPKNPWKLQLFVSCLKSSYVIFGEIIFDMCGSWIVGRVSFINSGWRFVVPIEKLFGIPGPGWTINTNSYTICAMISTIPTIWENFKL